MIRILRPIVVGVFPASLERTAARVGLVCATLAICVGALFPVSAHAGTEDPRARWTTTVALAVAWALLTWSRGRLLAVGAALAALVVAGFAAPATWLLLFAGMGCVYAASALVPRSGPFAGAAHPDDEDPPLEGVQEVLESLGMALVLALLVREFGFEAFKIPTGSMEPTILGDGTYPNGKRRQGDRLLAFKCAEIRRWDITVFRFPLFRNTNYIKRAIGLPGEHVEIRDGDIYVNGEIAPKPDDVQRVMWRSRIVAGPEREWVEEFERDENSPWICRKGFVEVDAPERAGGDRGGGDDGGHRSPGDGGTPAGGADSLAGVSWAQLRGNVAEDQRVSFDVEVRRPGGDLCVSLEGAKRRCVLRLGQDGCEVTTPGGVSWKPDMKGLAALGPRFRLGFAVSDRVVRVFVDGRQVDSFRHPDVTNDGLDSGTVRLGARGLSAVLRNLLVEDDVQYQMFETTKWDVPDDGYVMLGDNTWSSRDSRYWKANVVTTKDGREFVAPDTARVTEEIERSVFSRRADGGADFIDSYGIEHHFSKDEVASIRSNVHLPFARKDDIVGRAFLIFWPFPPAGDFRPRFLR